MAEKKVASPEQLKRAEGILDRFYNEILVPTVAEFKPLVEPLRTADIRDFGGITGAFIQKTLINLYLMFDMPQDGEFEAICPGLGNRITFEIIGEFNEALPSDFPYIIALINHPKFSRHMLVFIGRTVIPGAHDLITNRVIPVFDKEAGIDGFFSSIDEFADFVKKREEEQDKN